MCVLLDNWKYVSRRTLRSSEEGTPRVETLVASRFVYETFRRSTSSSLKPKTLVEGPFNGSRTVYRPPSFFTTLYHRRSHYPLV